MTKMITPESVSRDAMEEASYRAESYLLGADEFIDRKFGHGYSARHPMLIGLCVIAAAINLHSIIMASKLSEARDAIK